MPVRTDRILVIGATNLPTRIDPAVMRPGRLDKKFFVGTPDYEARVEMLRLCMANRPQDTVDWHRCAGELENYTSAEIEFLPKPVSPDAEAPEGADGEKAAANPTVPEFEWNVSIKRPPDETPPPAP